MKAGHEAAYKHRPLSPKDHRNAIIALRHPSNGKWFGSPSRTLDCGGAAAVLHYNVFSRMATALANQLFGIPPICFFDGFAALSPRILANKALRAFTSFCSLLGVRLMPGKSDVGSYVTSTGVRRWFPCGRNSYRLHISPPVEKRRDWAALLDDYILKRPVSTQGLEQLIGRLSFSHTLMRGEFARTQLRPLYQRQFRRVYNARQSSHELQTPRWRRRIVSAFEPRIPRPCSARCDWVVYTDAASTPPRICAFQFYGEMYTPALDLQLSPSVRGRPSSGPPA